MQWSGNTPNTGLTSASLKAKVLDQLNHRVTSALAGDPAFQIRTVDGHHWICPYTGTLVPSTPDSRAEPQRFLFQRQPWLSRRGGKTRPIFQILVQKWTLHLSSDAGASHRQFDAAGQWLDPICGQPRLLPTARSAEDPQAIPEIAAQLAATPKA